jgi:hypothetical protein
MQAFGFVFKSFIDTATKRLTLKSLLPLSNKEFLWPLAAVAPKESINPIAIVLEFSERHIAKNCFIF